MRSARLLLIIFVPTACFVAALTFGDYDPGLDLYHDGSIDGRDVFDVGNHWEVQDAGGVGTTDLLKILDAWHEQEPTGDRVLSLPELFQVPVEEVVEGYYMGNAGIPVHLSEVNGLTEMEFRIPISLDTGESGYDALVTGSGEQTVLTSDFSLSSEIAVVGEDLYYVFKISSVDPITESGPGDLLIFQVSVSGTGPLAEEVVSPLVPENVRLLGVGGVEIQYSISNGSILVMPSGPPEATPTPTSTGTGSTRTPTPTRTKAPATSTPKPTQTPKLGVADSLQIVACKSQEFAGNVLSVYVDQIDDQGHIVNPGVEGGDAPRAITVTVNGSATIGGTGQNITFDAGSMNESGLKVNIVDTMAQEVTITAEAPGVGAADPFVVEFVPGGNISGTVEVADGQGGFEPAPMMEIGVNVHIPGATTEVTSTMVQMVLPPNPAGYYATQYIAPGTYDVSFEPLPYGSSVIPVQPICIEGVEVKAGETTTLDAQLPERIGPRVFGTITTTDGEALVWSMVTLSPVEGNLCGLTTYTVQGQSQDDVVTYEFKAVPAGSYRLFGTGAREDKAMYTNGIAPIIDVADQDVEWNVEFGVFPYYPFQLVSPINYSRAADPPTFVWSVESGAPEIIYRVTVMDRCNQTIWEKADVSGTQVEYDGPALQRNNIYHWSVLGITKDGSSTWMSQNPGNGADDFLVE